MHAEKVELVMKLKKTADTLQWKQLHLLWIAFIR